MYRWPERRPRLMDVAGCVRTAQALCLALLFAAFGSSDTLAAATHPVSDTGRAIAQPAGALLARIDALVDAMNRSDDKAIAALMTSDAVIVDEVAPYRWIGPDAERHWSRDDGLLIGKHGVTMSHSARGTPTFLHRTATRAYVIVPLAYDYTVTGKRQHEAGLWTIVFVKTQGVWHIALLAFAKTGDTRDATWKE